MNSHIKDLFEDKDKYFHVLLERQYDLFPSDAIKKLDNITFGIAGLGGNGGAASEGLVRLGAHHLIIADMDSVELNNLNRQPYTLDDVGKKKTEAMKQYLQRINPFVDITCYDNGINSSNCENFVKSSDIVIDAVDDYPIKVLLSRYCKKYKKPYIHSAGAAFIGHVSVFLPDSGPTYEELFDLPSLNKSIEEITEEEWSLHRYTIAQAIAKDFYSSDILAKMRSYSTPWLTVETPCRMAGHLSALEAIKVALGLHDYVIKAPRIIRLDSWYHRYSIINFKKKEQNK